MKVNICYDPNYFSSLTNLHTLSFKPKIPFHQITKLIKLRTLEIKLESVISDEEADQLYPKFLDPISALTDLRDLKIRNFGFLDYSWTGYSNNFTSFKINCCKIEPMRINVKGDGIILLL